MSSPDNAPDGSEWGSEDCLTLNVFVPSPSKSSRFRSKSGPLPVLVSVHGGSSVIGWSGWDEHSALLQRHPNYVVVTFNYRLHAFGYLALEALSAVSPTSTSGTLGIRFFRCSVVCGHRFCLPVSLIFNSILFLQGTTVCWMALRC